ncbi:hypothetical protein Clacol_009425 [Clathrus columnatus]|uniref:Alpha/beta-hydrolase n=1 Tax=Clathrus columnatus TaxID=1419009 RepID=A0AAV5AL49_9AGAM|nr:hypothetical protein Clacol_009425 [Clathrus columnatus]
MSLDSEKTGLIPNSPIHCISTKEKVGLIAALFPTIPVMIGTIIRYPFSKNPSSALRKELIKYFARKMLCQITILQTQWVLPTSTEAYVTWIRSRTDVSSEPSTENFESEGFKIHWIGSQSARKIILHYPSGGYAMPLHKGHFDMLNSFRKKLEPKTDVKLAVLEYALTPYATYPTQFRQAVLALNHILSSGASPNDILLFGDSAGGLLLLQVIAHILHPYPTIPPLPQLSSPFLGLLFISPWVTFGSSSTPPTSKRNLDYLNHTILTIWGDAAKKGSALELTKPNHGQLCEPGGYWGEPMKAPSEWWNGVEKISTNILITSGDWEFLHNDIQEFGKSFKQAVAPRGVKINVLGEPNGVHMGPVFEKLWDFAPNTLTDVVIDWVYERII